MTYKIDIAKNNLYNEKAVNYKIVIIIIIIIIIIIMNFIKVSCLIAQAQCLTNWRDCIIYIKL